jgi:hypothetical protein
MAIDRIGAIQPTEIHWSVVLLIGCLCPTPTSGIHYQFYLIFHGDFIPLSGSGRVESLERIGGVGYDNGLSVFEATRRLGEPHRLSRRDFRSPWKSS